MPASKTGSILIIDGHGCQLLQFCKGSPKGFLWTYAQRGTGIAIQESNEKIKSMLASNGGSVPEGATGCINLTKAAGMTAELKLTAPHIVGTGSDAKVQWSYDVPDSWYADILDIPKTSGGNAKVVVHYPVYLKTAKVILIHPEKTGESLLFSDIAQYFSWKPFDYLWMACLVG